MRGCPCGYDQHPDPAVNKWSEAWHTGHRAAHLAAFPDVDQITRDTLTEFIDRAAVAESPDPRWICTAPDALAPCTADQPHGPHANPSGTPCRFAA